MCFTWLLKALEGLGTGTRWAAVCFRLSGCGVPGLCCFQGVCALICGAGVAALATVASFWLNLQGGRMQLCYILGDPSMCACCLQLRGCEKRSIPTAAGDVCSDNQAVPVRNPCQLGRCFHLVGCRQGRLLPDWEHYRLWEWRVDLGLLLHAFTTAVASRYIVYY